MKRQKILIVENDQITLDQITSYLNKTGAYELNVFYNGKGLTDFIQKEQVELVIIDDVTQEINGAELTKAIKAKNPWTQIIMLTAFDVGCDQNKILDYDVDDFIYKPIQMDEFDMRLKSHLKIYNLLKNLNESRNQYQTILESFITPVFVLNQDQSLLYLNRYFKSLYGLPQKLQDLSPFFPKPILNVLKDEIDHFFQNKKKQNHWLNFKMNDTFYRLKFLRFDHSPNYILAILYENQGTTPPLVREDSLKQASYIQKSLMPKKLPSLKKASFEAHIFPSPKIGGDLFLFFEKKHKYYFILADILGQGVSASHILPILSLIIRNHLPILFKEKLKLFLHSLNQDFVRLALDYFSTAVVGCLDIKSNKLSFVSAGHKPPRYLSKEGAIENVYFKNEGIPIGFSIGKESQGDYYHQFELNTKEISKIAFYTDGMVDFFHSRGRDIDYSFIDQSLIQCTKNGIDSFKNHIQQNPKDDDASLFLINLKPSFKEEYYLSPQVNLDLITDDILKIIRDYDFSESEIKRSFMIVQEMIGVILCSSKSKGIMRVKINHKEIIFTFKIENKTFDLFESFSSIRALLKKSKTFPEALIEDSCISSSQLGIYMTLESADHFYISQNGRAFSILLKKNKSNIEYHSI